MSRIPRVVIVAGLCLLVEGWVAEVARATVPSARVVSASFYDINDPTTGPMLSTSIAGVPPSQYNVPTSVRVSNWNNLPLEFLNVPGSNLDLYDSNGVFTSVDVDWEGTDVLAGPWNHWNGGTQVGDSTMMNGAIQSTLKAPTDKVEIKVSDLANAFDIGNGYDVIIYADQDGVGGMQSFFVDDGITVGAALRMTDVVDNGPNPRVFDPALDYDEGTTDGLGSWIRFSGLRGASFTIEALAMNGTPAFVSGFQIVGYQPPGYPGGDLDGDGEATGMDFLEWQRGYSTGFYSHAELVQWQAAYGSVGPIAAGVATVPEPGISALLAGALMLAGTVRLRRD